MAVAWESYASGNAADSSATSYSVSKPTGTADGDLLLWVGASIYTRAHYPPAGWTELVNTAGTYHRLGVFYKVASSEPSSYSITCETGYTNAASIIVRLSGADTPIATAIKSGADTTAEGTDITTTVANSLVLWIAAHDDGTFTQADTTDRLPTGGFNPAYGTSLGIYSEEVAAAGVVSARTITISAYEGWTTVTVAIAPSASGPTIPILLSSQRRFRL